MLKTDFEIFCQMSKDMGATCAKAISPQSVVTAAWVRLKCQFGGKILLISHCKVTDRSVRLSQWF